MKGFINDNEMMNNRVYEYSSNNNIQIKDKYEAMQMKCKLLKQIKETKNKNDMIQTKYKLYKSLLN